MAGVPVQSSDPYDILLGHNRWATAELLGRCRGLSEEEFHRGFDIGPGSLHDTLTHIIGCMRRWADRIDGRELRDRIEGERRLPGALLRMLDEAAADFAGVVGRARPRLNEVQEWVFGEETHRFTVAAAVLHVTNHGVHHRAQCMNMFKRLGQSVGADLDELEWQVAGEPGGTRAEAAQERHTNEPEVQRAFAALREQAREALLAGPANVRLAVFPSFSDSQSLAVAQWHPGARIVWRIWRQDVDYKRLCMVGAQHSLSPTIEQVEATIEERIYDELIRRTEALSLPARPREDQMGCDGTSFELALSSGFSSLTVTWWQDTPPAWRPAMVLFADLWKAISRRISLPEPDRITSFPWTA